MDAILFLKIYWIIGISVVVYLLLLINGYTITSFLNYFLRDKSENTFDTLVIKEKTFSHTFLNKNESICHSYEISGKCLLFIIDFISDYDLVGVIKRKLIVEDEYTTKYKLSTIRNIKFRFLSELKDVPEKYKQTIDFIQKYTTEFCIDDDCQVFDDIVDIFERNFKKKEITLDEFELLINRFYYIKMYDNGGNNEKN